MRTSRNGRDYRARPRHRFITIYLRIRASADGCFERQSPAWKPKKKKEAKRSPSLEAKAENKNKGRWHQQNLNPRLGCTAKHRTPRGGPAHGQAAKPARKSPAWRPKMKNNMLKCEASDKIPGLKAKDEKKHAQIFTIYTCPFSGSDGKFPLCHHYDFE